MMYRFRLVRYCSSLLLWLAFGSSSLLAQGGLVAEGMITPTNATASADIVVMQVRTAAEAPGPPVVVPAHPPRLLLSTQSVATGPPFLEPYPQNLGRLAAGTWTLYSLGVDWRVAGRDPRFDGFLGPASFHVTRGEVYPKSYHPVAGESFLMTVESPAGFSCTPKIDHVSVDLPASKVVLHALPLTDSCEVASPRLGPFKQDFRIPALATGRYTVEVQIPRATAEAEVYAAASFRVVAAEEPRLVELRLDHDPARDSHELVAAVEIPSFVSAGACRSWQVIPRNSWVHGRNLYAHFDVAEISRACTGLVTETYRLPLPELETGLYRILAHRELHTLSQESALGVSEYWAQSQTLVESQQLRQLIDDRFEVTVTFLDHSGRTGNGTPVRASTLPGHDDLRSALFSFFSDDNWEVLVKVLDGCTINNHYWVFASAATDVEYTLRVEDTLTGSEATYRNDLGTVSPAITDTMALAPCE